MDTLFRPWYTICVEWFSANVPHPILLFLILLAIIILLFLAVIYFLSAAICLCWIYQRIVRCLAYVAWRLVRRLSEMDTSFIPTISFSAYRDTPPLPHPEPRTPQTPRETLLVKPKAVTSVHPTASATSRAQPSALKARPDLSFCKKTPTPANAQHLTKHLMYLSPRTNPNSKPRLERPYISSGGQLYAYTHVPEGVNMYALFTDGEDLLVSRWPDHTTKSPVPKSPKSPGPPTPKADSPPSSHSVSRVSSDSRTTSSDTGEQ